MVDYWVRRIPHDLEYNTGTTIWNILTELRDLYFPFEMYFDDDTFVCKEIPSGYDDPVVLDENTFKSMVISENASVDYSQIHNCVEVWGASNSSDYFCKDKLEKMTLKVLARSCIVEREQENGMMLLRCSEIIN